MAADPSKKYLSALGKLTEAELAEAKDLGYVYSAAAWGKVTPAKKARILAWLKHRDPANRKANVERAKRKGGADFVPTKSQYNPPAKPSDLAKEHRLPRGEAMRSLTASFAELGQVDPMDVYSLRANTVFQAIAQGNLIKAMSGDPHNTKLIADFVGESPKVKAELLLSDAEGNPVSGMEVVFRTIAGSSIVPPDASRKSYRPGKQPE